MESFRYTLPATDIVFGKGSLSCVGAEVKKLGRKALLVTGKISMKKLGFLDKCIEFLEKEGIEVIHYGEVTPNPTVDIVNRGAQIAIDEGCDVTIGLGGGSAIDTAKNIAVVAGHFEGRETSISIWDFSLANENPRSITSKTLPVVAITSTSGTGSHVSRFAVVTNEQTREKIGILSPFICPKVSIVDSDILSSMSPSLTSRTGFDVMAHLTECFVSRRSNPITDIYCLKGMELVLKYLPEAFNDGSNLEARENMAIADTLAGWALVTSRPVLPHALSHPVSAFYPAVSHGEALAALTCESIRFNIENGGDETVKKYCQIAQVAGKKINSFTRKEALKSVEVIEDLLEKINLNITLKDLGVEEDEFEDMVKSVFSTMKGPIEANPVTLSRDDILNLYKKSM